MPAGLRAASCGSSCTATAAADLDEHSHTWKVKAYDRVGNDSGSGTRSFNVAVAPVADLVAAPNPVLTGPERDARRRQVGRLGTGIANYRWDLDGDGSFRLRTLKLKATDNVSGVGGVQITTTKRKPGKVLKFRKKLKVKPAKKLFVRVQDRAGNFSGWKPVRGR
jgi:hypothetical protein